ncbi:TonB-dependent receptor [Rufibacter immobilis]|uniref:TonB-dependent receptor n=1 Tax=Rufibacter immobilis TaxID=1348778 RepID=UPI0035E50A85
MRKLCFLFLFINSFIIQAQNHQIIGSVKDEQGKPIESANILLLSSKEEVITYAISKGSGEYSLKFNATIGDSLWLTIRYLGYKEFKHGILLQADKTSLSIDGILIQKNEDLDEVVVIESSRPITVNKDTISYNLDFYTDNNEQTVEDVLKKLPGISVADDGTIKYGNKEISRILIDGDNLVDDQYTLLSKNLDSDLLKNVQVLRNHDENPLRKKFGEGDDVAINLSIKEDKKNILFGKLSAGSGTNQRYNTKSNLGLLKEQFKVLNINDANNNGFQTSPKNTYKNLALQDLWEYNSKKEAFATPVVQNEVNQPGFLKAEEALPNKSELGSITTSYKWNNNLSIRSLTYFSKDKLFFDNNTYTRFLTEEQPLTYTEQIHARPVNRNLYLNTELKYYNQKNWYTTFEAEYRRESPLWNQGLLLNDKAIKSASEALQHYFNNHLYVTYQASESFLLENYAYFSSSRTTQDFFGQGISFRQRLEEADLQQFSKERKTYAGLNSRLKLSNARRRIHLAVGIEKENDHLQANIFSPESNIEDSLQSSRKLNFTNFHEQASYTFYLQQNKSIEVEAGFTHKVTGKALAEDFHLVRSGITYLFSVPKAGKFALNYTYRQQLSDYSRFYSGYALKDYRTLVGGATHLLRVNSNALGFTHNYQDLANGFLLFNIVSYTSYDKGYITQNFINEDFTVIETEEGKGGRLLLAQNQVTTYVAPLYTSFKLESTFSHTLNYLSINLGPFQKAKNYNVSSRFSGTTYFNFPANLRFSAEYQKNRSIFNEASSQVNNYILSNEIIFKPNDKLVFTTTHNFYHLSGNKHSFLAVTVDYKPERSKWAFQLSGQNLLGVQNFRTIQTSDFRYFEQKTLINKRYIMLMAHLRL